MADPATIGMRYLALAGHLGYGARLSPVREIRPGPEGAISPQIMK